MNQKKIFGILIVLGILISGSLFFAYKSKTEARSYRTKVVKTPITHTTPTVRTDPEFTELSTNTTTESGVINNNHYLRFAGSVKKGNISNSSTISIQLFGDIMLDRNVAKNMGTQGLDYLFENFYGEDKGLYHHADLLIANLEGPLAPARVTTTKSIAFRFDPGLVKQFKQYQFDGFSLANNHSLDMGWKNVDFTEKTLKENGFGYFGNQIKENRDLIWVADISGKEDKVAFIGLNNTDHPLDMPKVSEAIKEAKSKARYVIAFMHWGVEYERISKQPQRDLAHVLIDKGVNAVIGAHPHVVEEVEIYKNKPIFYSLGNFVFDQYFSNDTQEGLSVGLILQDGVVKTAYVFPFYGVKSQIQLMESDRRNKFLKWLNENSRLGDKKFENGKLDL
jgi:poly-gamma-glutamate synthesis protein (capsule biosynthesis protein)